MTSLTRIHGYAHVAQRYGLDESIFLDTIVHWWRVNRADDRNFHDGRWWTYNSMAAFAQTFPWWSAKQIRRIAQSCRDQGAVHTGNYNENQRDRTIWYSPSDELLALYGDAETGKCNCPNGQMQLPEQAQPFAQTGQPLPCSNHVGTYIPPYSPPKGDGAVPDDLAQESALEAQPAPVPSPTSRPRRTRRPKSIPEHCPERFEKFWAAYPRDEDRAKAVQEWDKLLQDKKLLALHGGDETALLNTISLGLGRHLDCEDWRKGVGIPYAFRWLRGRKWTEKTKIPVPRPSSPADPASDGRELPVWT